MLCKQVKNEGLRIWSKWIEVFINKGVKMNNLWQVSKLLGGVFPNFAYISYVFELRKILGDCQTVLDIGCGPSSPIRFLEFEYSVGVDGHEPSLTEARNKGTHNEFHLCDVREISKKFTEKQFDCCVAADVIEHLHKEDGYQLIRDMERIASTKVVIFTPNGFMPQQGKRGNLQKHLSGWDVDEMEKLGYRVVGMFGHNFFRGESHNLRFRPKFFWGIISELTHYLYARKNPRKAAAILCIKNVVDKSA